MHILPSIFSVAMMVGLYAAISGMGDIHVVRTETIRADLARGSNIAGQDGGRSKSGNSNTGEKKKKDALKFIWPTSGRKIVEGYGERTNPKTGTVTMNPGINIAARSGSAVTASERGTVSLVSWLPGYGTIVIVQHRGGYRTVYGNLASASVTKGASVAAGQRIGSVGVVLGEAFVHFEVWRDQTRLDPMSILPKK